jgi:hypothetical protein
MVPWPWSVRRVLADQAGMLCEALATLARTLRQRLAAAAKEAVRVVVEILLDPPRRRGPPYPQPSWRDPAGWNDDERAWRETDPDPWADDLEEPAREYRDDERDAAAPKRPSRWRVAFAAALEATVIWLRRQKSRLPIFTVLAATVAALSGTPLVAALAALAGTTCSLLVTVEQTTASAADLAGALQP